uniref:Uncharacterized protein n=1 Tax=Leptospirillum ferrodiazotrophum TaxID=412449 RepID=C6HTT9_9BACT|nr:MAG: hypothetical protein UBAL3_44810005 [Leptospirillum ferrodiazotrophum]
MEEDGKKVPFSVRLPESLVERLKADAQKVGLGTSDWVTSLLDETRKYSPGQSHEPSGPDLSGFITEMIDSLRAEIRGSLSASFPPDLTPVLEAIGDLSRRFEEREAASASAPSGDPSPPVPQLEEILALLRAPRSSGETESEAHALSFLSLQMGELQQGIERLSVQMETVVRSGRNGGGGGSPEIKDELIRLSEAAEHQSALTGEILRIGDAVREIRERLQKNPLPPAPSALEGPEKGARKESRHKDPDPLAEKKKETRQFGWAVGILLVFFLGFVVWEIMGWYNGGDTGSPPAVTGTPTPPKTPAGTPGAGVGRKNP